MSAGDFLTGGQEYAGCPAILDDDVLDVGIGPDGHAPFDGNLLECLGDCSHRTAHVCPASAIASRHAHRVIELDVPGASISRTTIRADDAAGTDGSLHLIAVEVVLGNISDRAHVEHLEDLLLFRSLEVTGNFVPTRWPTQDVLVHDPAGNFNRIVIDVVGIGVLGVDLADAVEPLAVVGPVRQRAAVGEWGKETWVAVEQLNAIPGAQFVEDLARGK